MLPEALQITRSVSECHEKMSQMGILGQAGAKRCPSADAGLPPPKIHQDAGSRSINASNAYPRGAIVKAYWLMLA
jgi:hypothetical protein